MRWLSKVDQPLLDEAVYGTERVTVEANAYPQRTIEDNIQANLALQAAAAAPSNETGSRFILRRAGVIRASPRRNNLRASSSPT